MRTVVVVVVAGVGVGGRRVFRYLSLHPSQNKVILLDQISKVGR